MQLKPAMCLRTHLIDFVRVLNFDFKIFSFFKIFFIRFALRSRFFFEFRVHSMIFATWSSKLDLPRNFLILNFVNLSLHLFLPLQLLLTSEAFFKCIFRLELFDFEEENRETEKKLCEIEIMNLKIDVN